MGSADGSVGDLIRVPIGTVLTAADAVRDAVDEPHRAAVVAATATVAAGRDKQLSGQTGGEGSGRELAQQPLLSNRANSEVVVPCYNVVDQRIDSRGMVVGWDGLNTKKKKT